MHGYCSVKYCSCVFESVRNWTSCFCTWKRVNLLSLFNTNSIAWHSLVILLMWNFQSKCWNIGILQESILKLVFFNFSVSYMKDCLPNCNCLQYVDNSKIYQHFKVKDLKTCCINIEKDLSRLLSWSSNNNLVFNATKTKLMLLTTTQMKAY